MFELSPSQGFQVPSDREAQIAISLCLNLTRHSSQREALMNSDSENEEDSEK